MESYKCRCDCDEGSFVQGRFISDTRRDGLIQVDDGRFCPGCGDAYADFSIDHGPYLTPERMNALRSL